jgi:RPGR ORF15 isoform (fragment)
MKILEVRDGFVKFEADNSVYLSSFIQIDGIEKRYIAQVTQLKRSGENSIAYAKILFLYDGSLQPYDRTQPSKESEIKEFTFDILNNSINAKTPVIAGETLGKGVSIIIDASSFDKKMLASIDDKQENNIIARNLVKQFNNLDKNVLIIDTLGVIDAKKITAGVDFKLPLDTASLAFMYQDCLNDATADSKSMIIEIFKDLSDYSQTVPFVPFGALKSIVDDMVDKSHVFKLLVLKNKLAKFDKLGYFAANKQEVDKIDAILNSKCAIIDLSKLDTAFQNRYLAFLYEKLQQKPNTQVLLELSNVISKKNLKNILSSENIPTTFITHSRFKYLNDIKNLFDNFIISPSFTNNEIFSIYSSFLKAMPKQTYLITGEAVNYIPLVSTLKVINEVIPSQPETVEEEEIPVSEPEEVQEELPIEEPEEEEIVQEDDSELEEISEEDEPEIIEEPQITNEEILANIEEKSEAVITEAAKDLTPPENMFGEEEEEEIAEPAEESLELEEDQEEQLTINAEYKTILEEQEEQEPQEEYDEIPITESFDTVQENIEEIEDYIPETDENDFEELSINEEFEQQEPLVEQEAEEEIEMPEGFDLDIDSTQMLDAEEETEELTVNDDDVDVLPIAENNYELEDIVELNPDEADENDIVIDMEEDTEDELPENIDEQIVKDVDKVFTTRKDDDISDSDLDFIDELNNDDGNLLEEVSDSDAVLEELSESDENDGILEEPQEQLELKDDSDDEILETRSASTPIVPVYDADIPQEDLVMSDPIQQGDTVTHAKYGSGVVEKMIKYGNKTLFSINFDNIGRRLLDPTLTEIKKS